MPLVALAARAQVARSTIARWESGKSFPRTLELEAVLNVLGVSEADRQWFFDALPCTRFMAYQTDPNTMLPLGSASQLLRAMRLRSGWSQTEVARHLGVTSAAVSQWERGSSWPVTENLHKVGYLLGAEPEEVVALSRGAMRLSSDSHRTLESFSEHVAGIEASLLRSTPNPLMDLEAISLESDALVFAKRETVVGPAAELLGEVRATYAHGLMLWGRVREARQAARKALGTKTADNSRWFHYRATVVYAQCELSGSPGMGTTSIKLLRGILDSLKDADNSRNVSYRTWVALTLADAEAEKGRESETFQYVQLARQTAEVGNCVDTELPRWEAKLLNRFGRYSDALSCVEHAVTQCEYPGHRAGLYLEAARSAIGLRNQALASQWLSEAESEITKAKLIVYTSQVRVLEMALCDGSVTACNGALSLSLGNR